MRRLEAENCLMMPGNGHGSFLVRVSESRSGEFSLSGERFKLIKCILRSKFGSFIIFY